MHVCMCILYGSIEYSHTEYSHIESATFITQQLCASLLSGEFQWSWNSVYMNLLACFHYFIIIIKFVYEDKELRASSFTQCGPD